MKNFLKNTGKILTSHVAIKILSLLNIMLILKFFSIEEFGNYSYIIVILNLTGMIIDPFLSSYLVHYKTFDIKKFNLGIILFSLILLFPLFFLLTTINKEINILLFFLFTLTFLLGTTLKSYTNVKEEYSKYGIIDVLKQLSILLSSILFIFVLKSNHIKNLLVLNYSVALIIIITLCFIILKKEDVEISIENEKFIKIIKDSKFLILHTAIIPLITFFDSFFIEKNLTDIDLGLYSFSLKIYNISLVLVVPIFTVLNIKQIEIAKKDNYLSFIKKHFKKGFLFSLLFLILAQIGNYIITQYIFKNYSETFLNTSILLFGAFFTYLFMPFSFLLAYRKYNILFLIGLISILTNICINYYFIKDYGTIIPATATFLSQLIINLGGALMSYKILKNN